MESSKFPSEAGSTDGSPATAKALSDAVKRGPGTNINITWNRGAKEMSAVVPVAPNVKKTYRFELDNAATDTQKRILNSWLREQL